MTEQPAPNDETPSDDETPGARLAWEVPEIAAVAILLGIALLVVGALIAGIVDGTGPQSSPSSDQIVGAAITVGAGWAGPLLAIVLLGVVGVCWWQVQSWSDAIEVDDDQERASEATGHIRRAGQISRWAQGALLLTVAGAIAGLVGTVMVFSGVGGANGAGTWSHYVDIGASLLAVVAIAAGGLWVARRFDDELVPTH